MTPGEAFARTPGAHAQPPTWRKFLHRALLAAVVYQSVNAPYTQWPERFPPLHRGMLALPSAPVRGRWCSRTNAATARPGKTGTPREKEKGS